MRTALLLLVFGLLLRLLFWQATADRLLPHAACYQGDAPYWQQLAQVAADPRQPVPTEVQVALRPPLTRWLISALWDGDAATAWRLRLLFAGLGALVAPLLFLAVRPWLGERPAAVAGWLCAASTGLLQLGSGLHGEVPYLLLFLGSMLLWPPLQQARPARAVVLALPWAALHGLATLSRAEHLLVFGGMLALLVLPARRRLQPAASALLAFTLTLLPWHLHAHASVDDFNRSPPAPTRTPLPWAPDALAALRELPGPLQYPALGLISDTVRHRGGRTVQAADLQILEEAYGPMPGPLSPPLVASYGPLNFYLANHPRSDGGFTAAGLDDIPQLLGGPERYPPGLLQVLPRDGQLSLGYPPHLRYATEGYSLGLSFLTDDLARTAQLLGSKLQFFWQGAAMGLGGYSLPLGLSGVRRQVDLTTATGTWPGLFRIAVLLLASLGLARLCRNTEAWPWLIFLLSKVAVTLAFFGYARQGALCLPVITLLLAVALEPLWNRLGQRLPRLQWPRVLCVFAVALVLLDGARWLSGPEVVVGGQPLDVTVTQPLDRYSVQPVSYR